jgi:hypothetical protein
MVVLAGKSSCRVPVFQMARGSSEQLTVTSALPRAGIAAAAKPSSGLSGTFALDAVAVHLHDVPAVAVTGKEGGHMSCMDGMRPPRTIAGPE